MTKCDDTNLGILPSHDNEPAGLSCWEKGYDSGRNSLNGQILFLQVYTIITLPTIVCATYMVYLWLFDPITF